MKVAFQSVAEPSGRVSADSLHLVAVNWRNHQVLIGEAKWTDNPTDHREWRDFIDRAEKVVHRLTLAHAQQARQPRREAAPWERHLILFSRRAVTPAVKTAAKQAGCQLMTFGELVADLVRLPDRPIR